MSNSYDTIVIGAGQAGLASAYYLQRAGSRFLVLDGGSQVGESWLDGGTRCACSPLFDTTRCPVSHR
jgi:cation diffusion facilitator CzcD-associated flavoprotein CzcO